MCTHLGVDPAPSPRRSRPRRNFHPAPGQASNMRATIPGWNGVPFRETSPCSARRSAGRASCAQPRRRAVELQSRFLSAVATSALASRRELGDKVRLLELRHSAENLPNQNSCRRVVEDASGLSTAISSTPSPCKNPKPVSCTMRSRAKREASCGRRCLRSPSASRRNPCAQ